MVSCKHKGAGKSCCSRHVPENKANAPTTLMFISLFHKREYYFIIFILIYLFVFIQFLLIKYIPLLNLSVFYYFLFFF